MMRADPAVGTDGYGSTDAYMKTSPTGRWVEYKEWADLKERIDHMLKTPEEAPYIAKYGVKGFPVGERRISWRVAEKAYEVFTARYGMSQSIEEIAERGGFSKCEMDLLCPEWRKL